VSEYKFYLNDSISKVTNVNKFIIVGVKRSQHYGEYKCEAHNAAGDGQSAGVLLNINVPAEIKWLTGNITLNETNPIDLRCDVSGYPPPVITWKKDGKEKGSGLSHMLHIPSSTRNDNETYVCIAENAGVGRAEMGTFVTVNYGATLTSATPTVTQSWIGQTVKLKCVADGVPTPVLTWKKPDGSELKKVTATENVADAEMKRDSDFGFYTCHAENGIGAAATRKVEVKQIKAPGSPIITLDVQATSVSVTWTAPDNGGSPITGYRVVLLQGDSVIKNESVTNKLSWPKGELIKNTSYTVKVSARNFVFEGTAAERIFITKSEGAPDAPEIVGLPANTSDVEITIKWNEPQNNGAPVTKYTVYQRTVNDDGTPQEWRRMNEIRDPSVREVAFKLEKGKNYEFVVTATNKFGSSIIEEEKIKKIEVLGDIPAPVQLTAEVKGSKITLKWTKPENNGAPITKYSVYQRFVNDEEWKNVEDITDTSKRDYVLKGDEGKEYEFVVTATNKYGESLKTEKKKAKVLKASPEPPDTQKGRSCDDQKTVLHAVYIAVIILLVIVILILLVLRWRTRSCLGNPTTNKRNKCPRCGDLVAMNPIAVKVEDSTQPSRVAHSDDAPTYATPAGGDYMPLHPSTRSWEVSREHVNIIKVIGKGAFSQVAQATVRNLRGSKGNITVAVKMLKANAPASDRKDLLSELELMKKLKPHPHVIKLMGCVTENDPLLVLIEYVPFGDLLGYLRKSRGLHDTYYKNPDVKPQTNLTSEQLMRFAWQIADGMCYLSSKKIIHRDLAARNVLVGEGEKCKVTDFGMARNVDQDDIYSRKSRGRLPVKWTAYEALMYGTYTTQSDVWSYGILLYEILTVGGSPYPDINARQIAEKIQEGYRMPKPRHVDEKLYQIMIKCWEENPNDRPTFEKLRKTMKDMERNHKTYVNLSKYDNSLYANINDLTAE